MPPSAVGYRYGRGSSTVEYWSNAHGDSPARRGLGFDPRWFLALGDPIRNAVGDPDEFCVEPIALPFGVGWSPSVETIEELVLGLGCLAQPFAKQQPAPKNEGEVLVIEVDGKCPPTAREEELRKRRGRRRPRGDVAGCQRHRGQAKRKRRGSKKRRKKGDKSKNGKEVVVVVMYTLKRGEDGRLHGPRNKKVWASFGGRKGAASWARAEATKRGFGPATTKTVPIVIDGVIRYWRGMRHPLVKNPVLHFRTRGFFGGNGFTRRTSVRMSLNEETPGIPRVSNGAGGI